MDDITKKLLITHGHKELISIIEKEEFEVYIETFLRSEFLDNNDYHDAINLFVEKVRENGNDFVFLNNGHPKSEVTHIAVLVKEMVNSVDVKPKSKAS